MADKSLIAAAVEARAKAYAPYSRFLVGAAVKDEYVAIHAGCYVENAAYPQGTCAEAGAGPAARSGRTMMKNMIQDETLCNSIRPPSQPVAFRKRSLPSFTAGVPLARAPDEWRRPEIHPEAC